jgi:hypothetical protein
VRFMIDEDAAPNITVRTYVSQSVCRYGIVRTVPNAIRGAGRKQFHKRGNPLFYQRSWSATGF